MRPFDKPHGCTTVSPYLVVDDADERGGVKDPGGTTWWIATRLE